MSIISTIALTYSRRARANRADIFRGLFTIHSDTKILDLGSEDGRYIADVVRHTNIDPHNVYIADIDPVLVERGAREFGFTPVVIGEEGRLPFPDHFFDIVHCSSVLEHVTAPKGEVWTIRSGLRFREQAAQAQEQFAREIIRVGRQYYVQTPDRWFPIESHSWLPFVGWLPRRVLIPVLRTSNKFWVKQTAPDWHLLDAKELSRLFPEGPVIREKSFGMVKSVTAWKADTD